MDNGSDAWAAALGAPTTTRHANDKKVPLILDRRQTVRMALQSQVVENAPVTFLDDPTRPLTILKAYERSVVQGDSGRPLSRLLDAEDADDAVTRVCFDEPTQFFEKLGTQASRLAIYCHGGLNAEEASISRIRVLAPYFAANGIYPLFYTWRTGFLETARSIIQKQLADWVASVRELLPVGFEFPDIDAILKKAAAAAKEQWDRAIEAGCQTAVKPIWTQMKQSAADGARPTGALRLVADLLVKLRAEFPKLEIHLVGHSAGSIVLGHLLDLMTRKKLKAESCTLFAPACTVEFALEHFPPAISKGTIGKSRIAFELLDNERELADSVGPYRKSLLYLVSRALETTRRMPLLGMEKAWNVSGDSPWNEEGDKTVAKWLKFWGAGPRPVFHDISRARISDGVEKIPLAHGSFDNDLEVMDRTLARILAIKPKQLKFPCLNLHGF